MVIKEDVHLELKLLLLQVVEKVVKRLQNYGMDLLGPQDQQWIVEEEILKAQELVRSE